MLPILLAIVSIIIVLLSLYGVLLPKRLVAWVRGYMAGQFGLATAIAVRLLLAALLWFTAPASQTPTIFRVFAILTMTAAVVFPFVGIDRIRKLIDHVAGWPAWALRLDCLLGVALGSFLLWSIWPAVLNADIAQGRQSSMLDPCSPGYWYGRQMNLLLVPGHRKTSAPDRFAVSMLALSSNQNWTMPRSV